MFPKAGKGSCHSLIEIGTGSLPVRSNDHVVIKPVWIQQKRNRPHLLMAGSESATIFNLPYRVREKGVEGPGLFQCYLKL